MAREVVVNLWCDFCMALDPERRTPANEHSVGILLGQAQPPKPRTIAACPEHELEHLKPLLAVIEQYGELINLPQQSGKKSSGGGRLSANPSGPQHQQTQLSFEQAGTRKGKVPAGIRGNECLWCPLTYSSDGGGFGRHLKVRHGFDGFKEAFGGMCPVCGEGHYELMLAHVKKSHPELGFTCVSQPYIWARDNGDPHRVYAAKLEQVGSLDPDQAWQQTRDRERSTAAAADGK